MKNPSIAALLLPLFSQLVRSIGAATPNPRSLRSDDEISFEEGSVETIVETIHKFETGENVDYLHCGPKFHADTAPKNKIEIILLHSSHHTKDDWKSSGVMEQLCQNDTNLVSVTAIDMPFKKNGIQLFETFWGLRHAGIISGEPVIIVTPAASGKTIVSAAEIDLAHEHTDFANTLIAKMVRGWVPISVGAVMMAHNDALKMFPVEGVPVMAVRGSEDDFGGESGAHLARFAGASVEVLDGDQGCYLSHVEDFVETLLVFANTAVTGATARSVPHPSTVVGPSSSVSLDKPLKASPHAYDFEVTVGTVTALGETHIHDRKGEEAYYHCGPNYGRLPKDISMHDNRQELLLLHGAKFTKEDWKSSGILQDLCKKGGDHLSVTALDLTHSALAEQLLETFRGLYHEGVISGEPLVIVTPSASGKAVVNAAEIDLTKQDQQQSFLRKMVQGWVCIACSRVGDVSEDTLKLFPQYSIPVMAMHGTNDSTTNKEKTIRLQALANAAKEEIKGGHACYLDSPEKFVDIIINFMQSTTAGAEGTNDG